MKSSRFLKAVTSVTVMPYKLPSFPWVSLKRFAVVSENAGRKNVVGFIV